MGPGKSPSELLLALSLPGLQTFLVVAGHDGCKFLRANWKGAVFAGVVAIALTDLWNLVRALNWKEVIVAVAQSPIEQASLAGAVVPITLLTFYLIRFRFNWEQSAGPFMKLMFLGLAIGNLGVLGLHILMGDAESLVKSLQLDSISSALIFLVSISVLCATALRIILSGDGGKARESSPLTKGDL